MVAKLKSKIRIQSQAELELRRYHRDVRDFKKWCRDNDITYMTYDEASPDDICILSISEYDLHDTRAMINEDYESYFLSPEDYETWIEEE